MKKTITYAMVFGLMALLVVGVASAYRGDPPVQGPNYSEDRHEAVEQAFENGDYDAWKSLISENGRNGRVLEVVNENNFAQFAEAHKAMESGDLVKAAEIRAELGLNNGNGPRDGTGFKQGSGMGQGSKKGTGRGHSGECLYAN